MYDKLTEVMTEKIPKMGGAEVYSYAYDALHARVIDWETLRQIMALWLNHRKIRHDKPYVKMIDPSTKMTVYVQINIMPKVFWEKYDGHSRQFLSNEFNKIWNARSNQRNYHDKD